MSVGNEVETAGGAGPGSPVTTVEGARLAFVTACAALLAAIGAFALHAPGRAASMQLSGHELRPARGIHTETRTMHRRSTTRPSSAHAARAGRPAMLAASVAMGISGACAAGDSAGGRFADFSQGRATVGVGGTSTYSAEHGYTIECRIWMDAATETAEARLPDSIMFQHMGGVDHKWLGLNSGRVTGLAAGSCRSWFKEDWIETEEALPTGRWVHLAFVIEDGIDRMYVDGILGSVTPDACENRINGAPMRLGASVMSDYNLNLRSFGGKLDWIRVSSTARYSGSSFAVPRESELVADAFTDLLVTFNGAGADDAFIDRSGRNLALSAGTGIADAVAPVIVPDCNDDGADDRLGIQDGSIPDSNGDGIPDRCQCGALPALPACCAGDVNLDGIVDGADLGLLLSLWAAPASTEPARTCDLDADGVISGADLGLMVSRWGTCGG